MNCNPFTLGHQYLAEYAAAQVAKLYIFVVEEDKSEFPFADRIELVKQGVKHIPNVEVLPSGKFIISQQTFSGYFNKAELQDVAVDSSEDVEIFGKEIAPTLGITVRFAGEEPTDNVTRQYNETMKKILPQYGVEFIEIPRKTFGDEAISASKVREALHAGDFDKIKTLVPETTLNYLRGRQSVMKKFFRSGDMLFQDLKRFIDENGNQISDDIQMFRNLSRYFTARIDVKLMATGDFQILNMSDDKAKVIKPAWLQEGGTGYMITSLAGKLDFIAKAFADGQIIWRFMALDIRRPEDYSKRIPYWIDYTKLTINGEVIFDKLTPAWHDKPYAYNMEVKAGDEIKIQVEWLPHRKDT